LTSANSVVLTVLQILALNADNATSNDSQTATLAQMENTFEDVNRAFCFNHTLQLSAKTLLKPFNAGMSSMKPALQEEEYDNFDDEMPMLLDDDGDSNEDGHEDGHDGSGEYLDGEGEPEDADGDEINELN
jgi:hypothetical protein